MNERTLGDNLQQLMRIHANISVSELARLTAIPQPTIHHILSGSTKNPRKKALEALSHFFSISIDQLTGIESLPHIIPRQIKEDLKLRTIPLVQWEQLKNWPANKVSSQSEILLEKHVANDSFAVIINDSEMEPLFPKQALLVFDSGKEPKDRDFVVVQSGHEKKILFNRLFIEQPMRYLKQNLADGDVKLIKLDVTIDKIIGTLIEVRIQY